MKRTPLKRSTTPMKRTKLASSSKKGRAFDAEFDKAKDAVRERSGGDCEVRSGVCTGRHEHTHHIRRRSQQGGNEPENLAGTCSRCHSWIHEHPAWSYENRWLVRS